MAPNRVSGRVVYTTMSSPVVALKVTSAPVERPIQFFCWIFTRSMKSRSSRSSMRRWAYSVIFSIHWDFSLRMTGEPQRSHTPSTTSSLASTHLQEVHQFTGMVVL